MYLPPPKTAYTSIDEVGKFNMIWNVSLVLIPVFLCLLGFHIYFQDVSWKTSTSATLLALTNVLVLRKTRKYLMVGIWSVLGAILICQASIFFVNDSHVVTDTMWCVMTGFFAFFMFGWKVGFSTLMLNLSGLLLFLFMASDQMVSNKGINPTAVDTRLVINVYYVAAALAFIIFKMMESNRQVNQKYSEQIDRNEILLKEIHHRVKNNLQITSSLLRLQSIETNDEQVREQFAEAIGRIRSMALVHEKMYHNDDLSHIDLKAYLISLAEDILHSQEGANELAFNVESEVTMVDIKNIVPISLIFNELITNSLKHAFSDSKSNAIELTISVEGEDILFDYRDNGTWKEPKSDNSFGLELIETLTDQMEGVCTRNSDDGTYYCLRFKQNHFFFNS